MGLQAITVNPTPRIARGRPPYVTSGFGPRSGGMYSIHYGIDQLVKRRDGEPVKSPEGTLGRELGWFMPSGKIAAVAAGPGKVIKAKWTSTGYAVRIDHGGGWYTLYCHLANLMVRDGQQVRAGQPLGIISFSPYKAGCTALPGKPCKIGLNHLHWQVEHGGIGNAFAVDPEKLFGRHLEALQIIDNPIAMPVVVKLALVGFVAWAGYKLLK
jgi:murein DD-endopeptidase MepM/ murein hydrolase activator NlpD